MVIRLWISVLFWLSWSSVCCGQQPDLKLNEYEPDCIESQGEEVTVVGTVDMTGADTNIWAANSVDIVCNDASIVTINSAPLFTCKPDQGSFYCNETDNTMYTVIFSATSKPTSCNNGFNLRMLTKAVSNPIYSNSVKYPLFKGDITETLEVDGNTKTIGSDCIDLSSDKNVSAKYSVSGLVLPYTVTILDSASNVLVDSTTQPDVTTVISSTTKTIYVKYEMTGSCSETTKICFNINIGDTCDCEATCIIAIIAVVLFLVVMLSGLYVYYTYEFKYKAVWVFIIIGLLVIAVIFTIFAVLHYDSNTDCGVDKLGGALIAGAVVALIIVAVGIVLYCQRKSGDSTDSKDAKNSSSRLDGKQGNGDTERQSGDNTDSKDINKVSPTDQSV